METCESGVEEIRTKIESGEDVYESMPVYQDDDELVYSQGYDWIQDSASVMYEGDEGEEYYDDQMEEGTYEEDEEDGAFYEDLPQLEDPQSFKYLKKKAKDLEKRGEI